MLEWLTGHHREDFLWELNRLKVMTRIELRSTQRFKAIFESHGELSRLLHDEKKEKAFEEQLWRLWKHYEGEYEERSPALTARLRAIMEDLNSRMEEIFYEIAALEEAAKKKDEGAAKRARASISEHLRIAEKDIGDAKEIVEHLDDLNVVRGVRCTAVFKSKLEKPFFRGQIRVIEGIVTNIASQEWRRGNSEPVEQAGYWSCPKSNKNLRIVFVISRGFVLLLDIFSHDEYERNINARTKPSYSGPFMQVIKPLVVFASS